MIKGGDFTIRQHMLFPMLIVGPMAPPCYRYTISYCYTTRPQPASILGVWAVVSVDKFRNHRLFASCLCRCHCIVCRKLDSSTIHQRLSIAVTCSVPPSAFKAAERRASSKACSTSGRWSLVSFCNLRGAIKLHLTNASLGSYLKPWHIHQW